MLICIKDYKEECRFGLDSVFKINMRKLACKVMWIINTVMGGGKYEKLGLFSIDFNQWGIGIEVHYH